MIHAISVFSVKYTVEFASWAMNFSIEESKENDLIIKAATGNIKTRTILNRLFSLTLQAVKTDIISHSSGSNRTFSLNSKAHFQLLSFT